MAFQLFASSTWLCSVLSLPAAAGRFPLSAHLEQEPLPPGQSLRSRLSPGFESTAPSGVLPHSTFKKQDYWHFWATLVHWFFISYWKASHSSLVRQDYQSEVSVCVYLSRSVRVLAWMMLRSHRAGFLPASACLCPYTSMATAPSVKYSMKSSVTDTASSYRTKERSVLHHNNNTTTESPHHH